VVSSSSPPPPSSYHHHHHQQQHQYPTYYGSTCVPSSNAVLNNFVTAINQNNGNHTSYSIQTKRTDSETNNTNNIYYCESCDKEFTNQGSYDAHCANHEQCRHPDCTFSGTKRVVIAHYHSKHGQFSGSGFKVIEVEGQKFRVLLGTSPEEVEQWREERRKKFPTAANTEKKKVIESTVLRAGGLLQNNKRKNICQSDEDLKRRKENETTTNDKEINEAISLNDNRNDGDNEETEARNEDVVDNSKTKARGILVQFYYYYYYCYYYNNYYYYFYYHY
jgi:hypothetical protein